MAQSLSRESPKLCLVFFMVSSFIGLSGEFHLSLFLFFFLSFFLFSSFSFFPILRLSVSFLLWIPGFSFFFLFWLEEVGIFEVWVWVG